MRSPDFGSRTCTRKSASACVWASELMRRCASRMKPSKKLSDHCGSCMEGSRQVRVGGEDTLSGRGASIVEETTGTHEVRMNAPPLQTQDLQRWLDRVAAGDRAALDELLR